MKKTKQELLNKFKPHKKDKKLRLYVWYDTDFYYTGMEAVLAYTPQAAMRSSANHSFGNVLPNEQPLEYRKHEVAFVSGGD